MTSDYQEQAYIILS